MSTKIPSSKNTPSLTEVNQTPSHNTAQTQTALATDSISQSVLPTASASAAVTTRDYPSSAKTWQIPVSAAIGGGIGAYLSFPFEGMKKRVQTAQQISFKPTELYRGSSSFAASVITATVAGMTFRHLLQKTLGDDHTSQNWQAFTAVTGGMIGATVGSTPVENTILTQQLHRCGPTEAVKKMVQTSWSRPWVGLLPLMIREAGFGGIMMFGGKTVHDEVYKKTQNSVLAGAAEVGASLVGAAATHPFDTIATYQQKNDGKIRLIQSVKDIYAKNGIRAFFAGYGHRAVLFTTCAMVIPKAQSGVLAALEYINPGKKTP